MTTRRTTPDPAEALADHLLTDGSGTKRRLLMIYEGGTSYGGWVKSDLVKAIRTFFPAGRFVVYPPQKPKRTKK